MAQRARVLLFTGKGKGKTTAALGTALRACGHGLSVLVVQFVKADASTGELAATEKLPGFKIVQMGRGFLPDASDPQFAEHKQAAEDALRFAAGEITSGRWDMVVLDEVCFAVARGLLEERHVCDAVRSAPADRCVILTGRGATPALIELADTATDMTNIRHAGDEGRDAQQGVEY